jgi:predicted phosphoribosyltransferase
LLRPKVFRAVSQLYEEFPHVGDETVCAALRRAQARRRVAVAALAP